jgi:hypothetical protein
MAEHFEITPSGVGILFEDGEPDPTTMKSKRRSYTYAQLPPIEAATEGATHGLQVAYVRDNGTRQPSVTTVLGCLEKKGLQYAAEKLSVQGAIDLARDGALPVTVDGALSRMKSQGLRFFQVWAEKGKRGTLAHDDLLALLTGKDPSDLTTLSEGQRNVVQAVSGWYADNRPVAEQTETMVASITHGYAGRLDFFGTIPVLHPTAKILLDLKTTALLPRYKGGGIKPPYIEHLLQLDGYEGLRLESGYEPADFGVVLRVDETGATDLFVTVLDPDRFLSVLGAYKTLKGLPSKPIEIPEAIAA